MFINFSQTIIPIILIYFFNHLLPFKNIKPTSIRNIDRNDILISMQIGRRFGLTGIATVKKKKKNSRHKSITSFRSRITYLQRFPFY